VLIPSSELPHQQQDPENDRLCDPCYYFFLNTQHTLHNHATHVAPQALDNSTETLHFPMDHTQEEEEEEIIPSQVANR
jgi:hypothetical protein